MKFFSISLWCFGGLFSAWGFLVLALASSSANIPIGLPSYGVLLMGIGFFYMAWKEFKKPKLQGKKATPKKVGTVEIVFLVAFLAYLVYHHFIKP
jgi:hypothetical protein